MKTSSHLDHPLTEHELQPVRLLEGGGSEFERRVLGSARLDGVPSGAAAQVAAALGMPPEALPPPEGSGSSEALPSANAPGSSLPSSALGKYAAGGLLGALGLIGAIALNQPSEPVEVLSTPLASPTPLIEPPARQRESTPESLARPLAPPAAPLTPTVNVSTAKLSSPARGAARVTSGHVGRRAESKDAAGGLLAEVQALDQVRAALAAGQTQAAVEALAKYEQRFPQGQLALEADVVRIDVALASGRREVAVRHARALIARGSAGRYRARLERLLQPDADGVASGARNER